VRISWWLTRVGVEEEYVDQDPTPFDSPETKSKLASLFIDDALLIMDRLASHWLFARWPSSGLRFLA